MDRGAANVCFLGPPGTGKSHLATALAIKACQHGHRTLFATAQQWVDRLEQAQHRNSLDDELRRLDRYRLLVIDEIGYLPLERQAANLLFALIARRYERGSIIVTSTAASRPGASPRRRHGRRRPHRPPRPPRHHDHAQGQELPPTRTHRGVLQQAAPATSTNGSLMTGGPSFAGYAGSHPPTGSTSNS